VPSDEKPEPEPAPAEEPKKPVPARPRRKKTGKSAYPVLTKNRMFAALVFGVFASRFSPF
jgi:hypothetical protein